MTLRERGFLSRLAAHLLIPLLVLSPLPPSVQADLVLLPLSVLLPSSAEAQEVPEGVPAERGESVTQDPLGNVTTFTRSEYVAEDGTTGIGPGGGTVRGEGGVELRVPEGALKKGATFKLSLVDPSELPTLFPNAQHEILATSLGAHHGSVLRLEASEGTRLEKEADLVFPLPDFTAVPEADRPAKPEDAFYYVHRRVERCADGSTTCPDPIVVFEVIDEARAEGEGSNARVVTASPPFFAVAGLLAGTLLLYTMSWSYEPSLLGLPRPGLIRGKALRTVWGSDGAAFDAVPDAHVTGTDAGGVALSSKDGGTFATSQTDGTYALWDYAFTGGTTRIDAALGPESASATAFEVSDGPGIGVYNKVAHANITFPAIEPPPIPPQVEIQVIQESTGNLISGVVVSGTALQIGFRSNTPETEYTIYGARVAGQELAVRQAQQGDRPGWTHVVAEPFTPTNPGTYTVEAAAAPGVGSPVNTSTTFRVIAEGGSVETDPQSPPKVITARLYPKPNAAGVPVTAFLNVAFTEPVRGIPGNVRLLAGETDIPIRISGVTPEGQVIEAISGDHEILTSLTIQPLAGLRYSTAYRLLLAAGITDLDPEPKTLEPFELPFTTFGPAGVGGTTDDRNGSAGIVVLGDRAYLTRTNSLVNGNVVVFDITDPVEPVEVAVSEVFAPRPYDIVGEQVDTGEKLIAVATGSTNRSKPASVLLFEASTSEVPQFVGAASLTSSAADGFTSRIAIHGGFVYSATVRKGIQGVEIQRAKNTWSGLDSQPNPDLAQQKAKTKLNTDGEGFGQDAVVINLPIPLKSNATPYYLNDIKAADISGQTLVAVAGEPGLILAQPFISGITYQGRPEREGTRLDWGYALALGRLQDRDVAVVVGRGTIAGAATTLLITLDVSNPQAPLVLGAVSLSAELGALVPVDVLLKDATALVGVQNSTGDQGFVLLVNLSDLATPEVSGRLEGVAGRLALDENGLLYGSARLSTGGSSVNGGVKTATLGKITIISEVTENPVLVALNRTSVEPQTLKYRVIPSGEEIQSSEIELLRNGAVFQTIKVALNEGTGETTLPEGFEHPSGVVTKARLVVNRSEAQKPAPMERFIRADGFEVLPKEPTTLSVLQDIDVAGVSQALLSRIGQGGTAPTLGWEITGGGGGRVQPGWEAPTTGLYLTEFKAGGLAGVSYQLEIRKGEAVLGRSAPIMTTPGLADRGFMTVDAPAYATGTSGLLPADGTTEVTVRLKRVHDALDNPLPDGTPVRWFVEGDAGQILAPETPLVGGEAITRYRAGAEPGQVRIWAAVDEKEYELHPPLEQVGLEIQIQPDSTEDARTLKFVATVSSAAGPPAEDTPISWSQTYGLLANVGVVRGGTATALWSEPDIALPDGSSTVASVIASVGRSRQLSTFALPSRVALPTQVSLDHHRLVPDAQGGPFSGQTAVHVQGSPGAQVILTVGSTRRPAVLPVAAFDLDAADASAGADDVYGGPAAEAGVGVSANTQQPQQGVGNFHFSGAGGLTLSQGEFLSLVTDFGISGHVRFESIEAGQKVIEKAGSYGLATVIVNGEPRLEFYVLNGGERKRVLSPQALAASTWYHFSAQLRGGRQYLAWGAGEDVQVGETVEPADSSAAPLTFGSNLQGDLDYLQLYDLSRAPFLSFPNGAATVVLALDEQGQAETVVTAAGALFAPAPGASQIRDVPIRVDVNIAPPSGITVESFAARLRIETAASAKECAEGIGTGENEEWSGIGCDISASLIAWLEVPLLVRDVVVAGKNVVKGKAGVADYIVGAITLATLVGKRFPVLGPMLERVVKANKTAPAPWVKKKVADKALDAAVEATEGITRTADEDLVRIAAGDAGEEAKAAFDDVARGLDDLSGPPAWDTIEQLGKQCVTGVAAVATAGVPPCFVPASLVVKLSQINKRFGRTIVLDLLRVLHSLQLPRGLTDDALEGIAIFMNHTRNTRKGPVGRVTNVWRDLVHQGSGLTTIEDRMRVMNELFTWIKQGEAAVGTLPGWTAFLLKGPGTLTVNGTAGSYHVLQYLAVDLQWKNIVGLEVAAFRRFIDVVVRWPSLDGVIREVRRELKNLIPGAPFRFGAEVTKDIADAKRRAAAVVDPTNRPAFRAALKNELGLLEYVFRGSRSGMVNAVAGLRDEVRRALGVLDEDLEVFIATRFLNRPIPF